MIIPGENWIYLEHCVGRWGGSRVTGDRRLAPSQARAFYWETGQLFRTFEIPVLFLFSHFLDLYFERGLWGGGRHCHGQLLSPVHRAALRMLMAIARYLNICVDVDVDVSPRTNSFYEPPWNVFCVRGPRHVLKAVNTHFTSPSAGWRMRTWRPSPAAWRTCSRTWRPS